MPYTDHGHWYGPGEPTKPGPRLIAKCFGLNGCAACRADAGLPPLSEPEPTPARTPSRSGDVPARHDRLAAAMLTPLIDRGLREAVKWVMEPELLAMETLTERRVRERLVAELSEPTVWPDAFGQWTADQAEAARAMKQHLLRRIARMEPHA
ncbi:hypothetical protein [Actinomadura litoris]|uniref:hypothetical protein n=1 Tax=Actinomadura litoris TaxID=2678616 RepID=UPI001FA73656|nr:hypothetical protein [Actinomadura litoris]